MRHTIGYVFGVGMAAAGAQAEYGRFMGVAAHSDHRMGGSDNIKNKAKADRKFHVTER
jgi:hypothetical protein